MDSSTAFANARCNAIRLDTAGINAKRDSQCPVSEKEAFATDRKSLRGLLPKGPVLHPGRNARIISHIGSDTRYEAELLFGSNVNPPWLVKAWQLPFPR